MKSFVRSTKRTCCVLGTRRHLKRYGVMSSTYQLLYTYCLCSVAEFISWYSKKCGRKICSLCPSCQLRKPLLSTAPLKPIIANGFFCRLQVHIIVSLIYVHVGETVAGCNLFCFVPISLIVFFVASLLQCLQYLQSCLFLNC